MAFESLILTALDLKAKADSSTLDLNAMLTIAPVVIWFGFVAVTQGTFVTRNVLNRAMLTIAIGVLFDVLTYSDVQIIGKLLLLALVIPRIIAFHAFWVAAKTSKIRKPKAW